MLYICSIQQIVSQPENQQDCQNVKLSNNECVQYLSLAKGDRGELW